MALYRCAACGSPNVVTDTQAGGISYNYVKGAIGTVALGVGGAAAGIQSKTQKVYKCPDCGVTLTYCMSQEIKNLIDIGVSSEEARKHLSFAGVPVSWNFFLDKYKNIESGSGDRIAAMKAEQKRLKELRGMDILKGKGNATIDEFNSAIDQIQLFEHRMGYDRSIHATVPEEEFTPEKPASTADYMMFCWAVDTFFENYFRFLEMPQDFGTKYRGFDLYHGFNRYYPFYLNTKMFEHFGVYPILIESPEDIGNFILDDPFLRELTSTYAKKYSVDEAENVVEALKDRDSREIGRYIDGPGFSRYEAAWTRWTLIKIKFKRLSILRPYFLLKDGALYYWDASFMTSPLSRISASDEELIRNNYFSYFPEKKDEYRALIDERKKALAEQEQRSDERKQKLARIDKNKEKIERLKSLCRDSETEIGALEKKVFGKKKAAEKIDILKKAISQQENTIRGLEAENIELTQQTQAQEQSNQVTDKEFEIELLKKFDYFIAWHLAEKTDEQ